MATNPIPKGSKNVTVNMPNALHADLKSLAKASSMTVSQYIREVLELARKQNLKFRTQYVVDGGEPLMAAEDKPVKKAEEEN